MSERDKLLEASGCKCPKCGGALVLRTPREGRKVFRPFYGCRKYPRCDGTLTVNDVGFAAVGEADQSVFSDEDYGIFHD